MIDVMGNVLAEGAAVADKGLAVFGATISCAITIIGAAMGIGFIGSRAVESIARQPEAGKNISTAMIISAAMIEGATFFSLLICMISVFRS